MYKRAKVAVERHQFNAKPFLEQGSEAARQHGFTGMDPLSDNHTSNVFMFYCVNGIPFEICQTVDVLPQVVKCGWTQASSPH